MRLIICSFCYAGSQRDEEWHKVKEEERLFIYLFYKGQYFSTACNQTFYSQRCKQMSCCKTQTKNEALIKPKAYTDTGRPSSNCIHIRSNSFNFSFLLRGQSQAHNIYMYIDIPMQTDLSSVIYKCYTEHIL